MYAQTTRVKRMSDAELLSMNDMLIALSPEEVIAWAFERFGERLVASTSFGSNAAVLLHLVAASRYGIPIIHIDTGDVPKDNKRYADELREKLEISVHIYGSENPLSEEESRLHRKGEDGLREFYKLRKLEPMRRALDEHGADAVLYGVRADQSAYRRTLHPIETDTQGVLRIYPMLRMTSTQAKDYIIDNRLPVHAQGYPGEKAKMECGLHV